MIDPISMASIGFGLANAGTGLFGAFSGFNSEADAARRQNQALKQQYKQALKIREQDWTQTLGLQAAKLGAYDLTTKANRDAGSLTRGQADMRLTDVIKGQNVETTNMLRSLAQKGGAAAASGKTGNNQGQLDSSIIGQYYQNQGVQRNTLMSAKAARDVTYMDTNLKETSANNQAWSQVAVTPMKTVAPLEPTQYSGPSSLGLVANVGTSLLGGVTSSYQANNILGGNWVV